MLQLHADDVQIKFTSQIFLMNIQQRAKDIRWNQEALSNK